MAERKDDTGWQDSGHGYSFRSFKYEAPEKPFDWKDLENTWFMSIPDGKGNVINKGGHWIDGKMVEEYSDTMPDPLAGYVRKTKVSDSLKYKITDNPDGSKTWELLK